MLLVLAAAVLGSSVPSAFTVSDDVANRRFVLVFRNVGRRTLCLSPASWPNEHGIIPITSLKVWVSIGTQKFPLETFIEDFATSTEKVRPGSTSRAYLDYDAFKIPDAVAAKSKILHLTPAAVICD